MNSTKSPSKTKERTLKQLQDLRDMLDELHVKNTKLDEENFCLKKEVTNMKSQLATALDTMRVLREDLKLAHQLINESRVKNKINKTDAFTS
ncbi:hypothetical protein RUM43_011573 [Polyplax serrata]|uniref:Uncharacterized protein n=1 Tax=Polyplax serrata TaxID=468196 RepID=A0AAN8P950_POLSC